jgi:exopolysaccharide biosynthesis polyprenyl glycosylphosphotransferase
MITKRESRLSTVMIVVQVALTLVLFLLTAYIFPNHKHRIDNTLFLMIQIAIVWGFFLYKLNLGVIFRTDSITSMLRGYLVTVFFGSFFLFLEILFISRFKAIRYNLEYVQVFAVINLIGLIGFKMIFHQLMLNLRNNGFNSRNVIIVADSTAIPFVNSFIKAKDWGYRIVSIVTPDKELKKSVKKTHYIPTQDMLRSYIHCNPIDDVFYCLPVSDTRYNVSQLIAAMDEIGVTLHIMQQAEIKTRNLFFKRSSKSNYNFVTHQTISDKYLSLKAKELFDLLFSVLILFMMAPLLALLAILIKAEDGGSIFFKQERIGQNGRRFKVYKFRTMVMNAEDLLAQLAERNEADGPTFKIANDPRITRVGRFLRKTSLDELPQFYNVLKGEMSVVGPRPPLLKEVQMYERTQQRRLSMKPGITCYWQVWGRHHVSFNEWMQMDLDYIDNWSIMQDVRIVLATVLVIFKADGQ